MAQELATFQRTVLISQTAPPRQPLSLLGALLGNRHSQPHHDIKGALVTGFHCLEWGIPMVTDSEHSPSRKVPRLWLEDLG